MGEIDLTDELRPKYGFPFLVEKNRQLEVELEQGLTEIARLKAELEVAGDDERSQLAQERARVAELERANVEVAELGGDAYRQLQEERAKVARLRAVLKSCRPMIANLTSVKTGTAGHDVLVEDLIRGPARENLVAIDTALFEHDEAATDSLCICHHPESEHDPEYWDVGCLHQEIRYGPFCDCDMFKASRGGDANDS